MTERVRVELRRTGGFTGRPAHVVLDSARMPPAEAAELVRLVSAIDPGLLKPAAIVPGADLMHYDLTVERGTQRWRGTVSDPAIPARLRPLLQFLTNHS
jgi:emfourin